MARSASPYQKLPGRWRTPFSRKTLWQGSDHLLWVEKTMMQEHYRRFYFKDIQAIIVCRNRRHHLWTLFWAALVLVTGSLAMVAGDTPDMPEFFIPATFTLIWAIGLLINLLKGPCCDFYLQTAVQLERLTNMARQRKALKMADRIRGLTEKAQGPFQAAAFVQMPAASLSGGSPVRTAAVPLTAPSQEPFRPHLHTTLFAVLLGQGALGGLQLWLKQSWLVALGLAALMATVVLTIIVLVRWHRQVKGTALSAITWLTLALAAANCLSSYGLFIYATMRNPEYAYNHAAMLTLFLEMHLEESSLIMALVMGFALGAAALGVMGLAAVAAHGGRHRRPS